MTSPLHFSTGGDYARDVVYVLGHGAGWGGVSGGDYSPMLLAGGPLDAPEYMPAGAHDSTSCRTGSGKAVPFGACTTREAV